MRLRDFWPLLFAIATGAYFAWVLSDPKLVAVQSETAGVNDCVTWDVRPLPVCPPGTAPEWADMWNSERRAAASPSPAHSRSIR